MIDLVTAAAHADPKDVEAYARHVASCPTCKRANVDAELCAAGGALWDIIDDDDPTEVRDLRR